MQQFTDLFSIFPFEHNMDWLVVWLPFFIFPYIGLLIIPIDFHIFQRGGPTTNQWILPVPFCPYVDLCGSSGYREQSSDGAPWPALSIHQSHLGDGLRLFRCEVCPGPARTLKNGGLISFHTFSTFAYLLFYIHTLYFYHSLVFGSTRRCSWFTIRWLLFIAVIICSPNQSSTTFKCILIFWLGVTGDMVDKLLHAKGASTFQSSQLHLSLPEDVLSDRFTNPGVAAGRLSYGMAKNPVDYLAAVQRWAEGGVVLSLQTFFSCHKGPLTPTWKSELHGTEDARDKNSRIVQESTDVVHLTAKCWLDARRLGFWPMSVLLCPYSVTSFRETWLGGLGVYMVPGRKKKEGLAGWRITYTDDWESWVSSKLLETWDCLHLYRCRGSIHLDYLLCRNSWWNLNESLIPIIEAFISNDSDRQLGVPPVIIHF